MRACVCVCVIQFSKTTGPAKAKFHVEPPRDRVSLSNGVV